MPWSAQERPGAPRNAQGRLGAPRSALERPGASRSPPGAPRSAQERPGALRSAQERPGAPRSYCIHPLGYPSFGVHFSNYLPRIFPFLAHIFFNFWRQLWGPKKRPMSSSRSILKTDWGSAFWGHSGFPIAGLKMTPKFRILLEKSSNSNRKIKTFLWRECPRAPRMAGRGVSIIQIRIEQVS